MLGEDEARRLVEVAVERLGGNRSIVGSPRHPFSLYSDQSEEVDGHTVVIRYGEISSPAIAEVEGWVFEVQEADLPLLDRPRRSRES